jgi:hypothetical protein
MKPRHVPPPRGLPAAPINPMRLAVIMEMNETYRRSGGGNGTPAITVNELAWLLDQLRALKV